MATVQVRGIDTVALEPSAASCFGQKGAGFPTGWSSVELESDSGETFRLTLPPGAIDDDDFPTGTELTLDYRYDTSGLFSVTRVLALTRDGDLELHAASGDNPHLLGAAGFDLSQGEAQCGYTPPEGLAGCSSRVYAAVITDGDTTVDAPCRSRVGAFAVTSFYDWRGEAPSSCMGMRGTCDARSNISITIARVDR